jgi:hypothetical protein
VERDLALHGVAKLLDAERGILRNVFLKRRFQVGDPDRLSERPNHSQTEFAADSQCTSQ